MLNCKNLTCWLFTSFCLCSNAQVYNERRFDHFTVKDGLSNNLVTGLAQDDYGYIWISTIYGLTRFDGKEMQRINNLPEKKGLISDKLKSVQALGKNLLVYSSKGAQWIDFATNDFKSLRVAQKMPAAIFQNDVSDVAILKNKTSFVSTYTGCYAFDKNGKIIFRYDALQPDANGKLPAGKNYGRGVVALDSNFCLLLDSKYQLFIYNLRRNSFLPVEKYKTSLPGLFSLNGCMIIKGTLPGNRLLFLRFTTMEFMVYDIASDKVFAVHIAPMSMKKKFTWASRLLSINDSTAILSGEHTGVYQLKINPFRWALTFDTIPLFDKDVITSMLLDKEHRLWLGTHTGIYKQNLKQTALHSVSLPFVNNPKIYYPVVFSAFLRHKQWIYAGSYTYLPINMLDGDNYELKKRISFETLSPLCNQVWHIIEYSNDTLWFATQGGLVWYNSNNGKFDRVSIPGMDSVTNNHSITLLYKDSKGLIWIQGDWGTGVFNYNPATKTTSRFSFDDKLKNLPLKVANFITEDKEHNIWLGENGLTRWNRKKDDFDTLLTAYFGFNKNNPKIYSLTADQNGDLIVCNENNGILIYNPVFKTFKQISNAQGLEENGVYNAAVLPNRIFWIVTHNFITAIDGSTAKTISYSFGDGLPSTLYATTYHDKQKNRLLFGFNNSIVWTPDSIPTNGNKNISFIIDAVHVTNDTSFLFPPEEIILGPNQNDLVIHYTALNFDEAESNRFAYRIDSKEWVSLGNANTIRFSNLAPGRYNLQIKFYAASGSNILVFKNLSIIIRPPFWKSWWFLLLLSFLVTATVFWTYKKQIGRIKQKSKIDKMLAELEMKGLHAQMNPHFIFNCLNSIREMILNDEPQQASRYLSKFAQLIRITLEQSTKPFISLQNNIDYLHRYVEMEQIRTGHFTFSINASKNIRAEYLLPPMLIQPFVENAIWHGNPQKENIIISICFFEKNNQLVCLIDDNGVGIEASVKQKQELIPAHHSYGIKNVAERIRVLNEKYNQKSSLTIQDKSSLAPYNQTGTLVTLYLSLKN